MTQQRAVLADQAFADYEFGEGVTVEDEHSSASNEWTRSVYVERDEGDDYRPSFILGSLPAAQNPSGNELVDQPLLANSQEERTESLSRAVDYQPVPMSASAAEPEIKGIKDWTSKPACCPYCGSKNIRELDEWESTSNVDDENTCRQTEYQCAGSCEGRSFWC